MRMRKNLIYVLYWSVINIMAETQGLVLVIFVEGQTDKEFYKKMVENLKSKYPDKKSIPVIYKNLQGVTNYNKAASIFQNDILKKGNISEDDKFLIICSYDYDVFKNPYQLKPPVEWKKVKDDLKKQKNVINIYEIKAHDSIEDWFLKDIAGLCTYLKAKKIPKLRELQGNTGEKKIKYLFLKNARVYQKGHNVHKFIDNLNFELLYTELQEELKTLVNCLFTEK